MQNKVIEKMSGVYGSTNYLVAWDQVSVLLVWFEFIVQVVLLAQGVGRPATLEFETDES